MMPAYTNGEFAKGLGRLAARLGLSLELAWSRDQYEYRNLDFNQYSTGYCEEVSVLKASR